MSKVINLLPKARQQEIRYQEIYGTVRGVIVISVVSFAVVFLAQFGTKLYLSSQAKTIDAEIQQLKGLVNKDDNTQVKNQIQLINDTVADYNNLSSGQPKWSNVLRAFVKLPPPGVTISSFSLDPQTKRIAVVGFAPTRQLAIQMHDNIQADSQEFYGVDYPLDILPQPAKVNFHFIFFVKDSLLK